MEEADHAAWMRRCLRLARQARRRGDPAVGAVVVRGGALVAGASERVRSRRDVTAHAELLAVRRACRTLATRDLSECALYTNVEPCWMCSFALREAGIGLVVIGLPVPDVGGASSRHPFLTETGVSGWGPPPALLWGVLAQECAALNEPG